MFDEGMKLLNFGCFFFFFFFKWLIVDRKRRFLNESVNREEEWVEEHPANDIKMRRNEWDG